MEQDLRAAARDSKIQAALCSKVSRERVGVELSGMLTGKVTAPVCLLPFLFIVFHSFEKFSSRSRCIYRITEVLV